MFNNNFVVQVEDEYEWIWNRDSSHPKMKKMNAESALQLEIAVNALAIGEHIPAECSPLGY